MHYKAAISGRSPLSPLQKDYKFITICDPQDALTVEYNLIFVRQIDAHFGCSENLSLECLDSVA